MGNKLWGWEKSWWVHTSWILVCVMFRKQAFVMLDVLLRRCALALWPGFPEIIFFAPAVQCECECIHPHIRSLTLHTWLWETSFFLAHLNVYSFIYGMPGNHHPGPGLLWQRGKAAQIYAWQQKLIRHQLTHANAYALHFVFKIPPVH